MGGLGMCMPIGVITIRIMIRRIIIITTTTVTSRRFTINIFTCTTSTIHASATTARFFLFMPCPCFWSCFLTRLLLSLLCSFFSFSCLLFFLFLSFLGLFSSFSCLFFSFLLFLFFSLLFLLFLFFASPSLLVQVFFLFESGEDRLAGETVIEVLAGSTGEPLVGLESTPEGDPAHDSDSKTD